MSVTTISHDTSTPAVEAGKGFFARMLDRMIEGRMKEAERRVVYHLQALDDETLKELGYDRATLRKQDGMASY